MASYWQKYGLTCDPFVDEELECEPFFPSRWHQQLDLLCHLANSTNMVLLVTGISGVGKTTFMEMLFKQIEPKAGVCKVHGSNSVTPDVLQELVIRHIGMAMQGSLDANFQQRFMQQIELMHQANDEFYLVIDNAHKLPKSSLALLVDIAEWQSSQSHPLHLILFGGPQLDAMMAEITAQHLGEAMTHTIRLEPFSLEMTRDYILHRMNQAGYKEEYPLNEMYTNQIHQASNGIPAKINIVARQVLLDYDPKNKKRKQAKQPKLLKPSESTYVQRTVEQKTMPVSSGSWVHTLTWLTTGAVIVVVIILFMVVYFKVPSNSKTTTQQVAVHKTPSSPASDNKEVADNDNISQADIDEEQTQAEGLNGMVAKKQPASETSSSVQNSMPATTMTEASEDNSTSTGDDTANVDSSMQSQSSSAMSPNKQESTASSSAATAPDTPEGQDNSSMWVPLTTTSQAKTDEGSDNNPLPLSEPLGTTSSPTQTTEATAVSQPAQSTEATSVSQPAQLTESTSPAEPTPTPSTKVTPPPVAHKTVKPVTNNVPVSNKMAVVSSYSLTSDEQALMEADANRYTVQIAAATNYYKLRSYIKSVGLEGQVYFFQTLNAGNPWYVVVYGDFNNAAAAKAAISKLPSVLLAKEKPWARSFGSVQKAIKAK